MAQSIRWNRSVTWPSLANGSEPSAVEVCSLFGYFTNFVLNSDPRFPCKPPSFADPAAWIWRTRRGYVLLRFLWTATCSSLIKCDKPLADFITWLPSPTPQWGRGKKADMFEANVMVKKYRSGRQEGVFFNEGRFHIILDLLFDICFCIKNKVLLLLLRGGVNCISSNLYIHSVFNVLQC